VDILQDPFENPNDYKVLFTEWPYGLEAGMKHIIVWMRHHLQITEDGRLTPRARATVDAFVESHFKSKVQHLFSSPEDKIQWGRSWGKFQSVPGIEHFHLFVRDIPDEILKQWTSSNSWLWMNQAETHNVAGELRKPFASATT
jgi:hypothetical protein